MLLDTSYQDPIWEMYAAFVLILLHTTAWETSVPMCGLGFAGSGAVQFINMMLFFYFSGFFSPGDIAPEKTIYLSPMALYVQIMTHGAAFAPGVLDGTNVVMYITTGLWLVFDVILLGSPFGLPKS